MRHHPSCPSDGAHVHPCSYPYIAASHIVWLDGMPLAATGDEVLADRIAELVNAHGLASVPDRIPDHVLWSPPHPDDRLIDFRLPTNPNTQENP